MTETIDAWVRNAAGALGIGFTEVVSPRNRVHRVASIAETVEGSASHHAPSPSQFLSVEPSVSTLRIASALDPRVMEHDPRNETRHADESEETDGHHFCTCAAS